jgi:excisionase family DNA binding protein
MILSDEYVNCKEAGRIVGVSAWTVWRWIKTGKLRAERVGRAVLIAKSELSTVARSPSGRRSEK